MARRSKYGPSITYSGPLFEKDVRKTFRQNARRLMLTMAEDAADMVRANLPRSSAAPHYADHVVASAEHLPGVKGRKWALTAAVRNNLYIKQGYRGYGRYLETSDAITRKRRSGKTYTVTGRGLWVYRRAGNAMKRGSRVARADLTKGLN